MSEMWKRDRYDFLCHDFSHNISHLRWLSKVEITNKIRKSKNWVAGGKPYRHTGLKGTAGVNRDSYIFQATNNKNGYKTI